MIAEGVLIAGKYRVSGLLGEGGMGYVVSAMHEQLEQRVAVKLLVPALAEDPDAAERFLREARAAVRIQSEHVARVLDVGEMEDGAPYLVMEFLSGQDLAQELDTRETLEIGVAIDYVLQACEAVAEAHALGVIHRDLKPANLFLTRRADGSPLVKVLDFGISKAMTVGSGPAHHSPSLTAAHSLLGSPAYMSPEQARRPKSVDTRTDIWSLGVILYEFLGGETPFIGDAPLEVLTAAVSDPMPSLRQMRPDVPRELEAVIAKCLEKKADDRYQTIAEFAEALRPFAAAESMRSISRIAGILRSVQPPGPEATTTLKSVAPARPEADTEVASSAPEKLVTAPVKSDKDTQMDWGKSQSGTRRSRQRVVVLTAGALALGVIAWFGARSAAERSPAPAPTAAAAGPIVPQATALPAPRPMETEASPPAAVLTAMAPAPDAPPAVSALPKPANGGAAVTRTAPLAPKGRPRPAAKPAAPSEKPPVDHEDPLENRH